MDVKTLMKTNSKEDLAKELVRVTRESATGARRDPVMVADDRRKDAAAIAHVGNESVEDVASRIAVMGSEIVGTLSALGQSVVAARTDLDQTQRALAARSAELAELHGKDVIQKSIGQMLADFEAEKALQLKVITEIEASHDQMVADRDARLRRETDECELTRKREVESWTYAEQVRQRSIVQTFEDGLRAKRREEEDRERAVSQDLLAKMQAVADATAKCSADRAALEAERANVEAQAKRELASALGSQKKDHDHKLERLVTEMQTSAQIAVSRIRTLEERVAQLEAQLDQKSAELRTAQEQTTAIANNALMSASGRDALGAVLQGKDNGATKKGASA